MPHSKSLLRRNTSEPTKVCPDCKRRQPWSAFGMRRGQEGPRCYCRECESARSARYQRERRQRDPEGFKAYQRDYYRRAIAGNPERYAQRKDYHREWNRRNFATPRERWRDSEPFGFSRDTTDAGPFSDWLLSVRPEFDTVNAMATALGVDGSLLSSVMRGARTTVAFSTVDRALCSYGRPDLLEALYPAKVAG